MDLLNPDLGLFFWTLIAFLFVLFILRRFAWKPILTSLTKREQSITDSIETAERLKKEMAQMHADNEKLMMQAREERAVMLKEAKETKDKIVNEAKEQAKNEANKIITDARQQITTMKDAAVAEVKNEIGSMAIAVAEKILKQQLADPERQNKYVAQLAENFQMN